MIVGFILFFALALVLGYAVETRWAWIALAVPVLFALLTALKQGLDGGLLISLLIALGITALGVLAGRALASRQERREAAEAS
jgi:predicted Co/Zn/Cd cation transporter (cation efflux family)